MVEPGWIWDACGLLNLAATGRPDEILRALPTSHSVVDDVLVQEVRNLRPLPEEDPEGGLITVDLSALVQEGLLQVVTLSAVEEATSLTFAAQIDDGEARTWAVARHRGLGVATDDRRAIRLACSLVPTIAVRTTPDWVRQWAKTASVPERDLREVIRRISLCGKWIPRRSHPDRTWWMQYLADR